MFNMISKLGASWFDRISDFMMGLFATIPQLIYFLYASVACFLDALQYVMRKLAGLDVYYINGEPVSGDIVLSFIKGVVGIDKSTSYSALTTVFWSLVIFGCILLVLTTIFQIIKAHYNYDSKKSHPFAIIGQSLKSLALMAIVPITAIFGLYISQILLNTLDSITSYSQAGQDLFTITDDEGNVVATISDSFEGGYTYKGDGTADLSDTKVYASYDIFNSVLYTNSTTFSGVMFKTAAYNCNRVRSGLYTAHSSKGQSSWEDFDVFYSNRDGTELTSVVAEQIDYAFANCLTLKEGKTIRIFKESQENLWDYVSSKNEDASIATSYAWLYGALINQGLKDVTCFSKFNVGLVYYYYNLWGFNFFIAFAGIFAFIVILGNVVFGLITRLIQLLALFFVFPPLIGIAPLDEGKAFQNWRKQFVSDVLMAYGAIIGMNLFFLILPFLNTISFFGGAGSIASSKGGLVLLDRIMNILIMLAGLTMVGNLIKLVSGFIGESDANKTGEDTRKATGELGGKALSATAKAGSIGVKVGKGMAHVIGGAALGAGSLIGRGGGAIIRKISDTHYKDKAERELVNNGTINSRTSVAESQRLIEQRAEEMRQEKASQKQQKSIERAQKIQDFKNSSFGRGLAKVGSGVSKVSRGVFATGMSLLGAEVKKKDGHVDVGGTLKGLGKAVLDVSEASIKLAGGDLLRIKDVGKKANDSGYMDPVKTLVKDVMGNKVVKGEFGKALTTKKEKEKKELDAANAQQESQAEMARHAKESLDALRQIAESINRNSNNNNNH